MRLLIIGNPAGQTAAATQIARNRGAKVTQVPDIKSALATLRSGQGADMVMVDVTHDVSSLITGLNEEHISIPVIGCGLANDTDNAVRAIKAGAKEYIPFPPDEALIAAVLEAITEESNTVIYHSPSMEKVMAMAKQVATSDANILITGESGTGKEMIARFIHNHSRRKDKDLISVNCAAIPDNLLESELFGHEKGAFTGAIGRRIGKFEEANNSTLLLDEISEIDIRLQAKLLRAIQEKEVDRIGGSKPVKLNFRILATSNRDLTDEVHHGRFRDDLYFRLNIINLHLPPLRDRKEDIPLFVQHFIRKYSESNGIVLRPLSKAALAKLDSHSWPGNVRELENTIHRAVLLASGSAIDEDAILLTDSYNNPNANDSAATSAFIGRTVDDVERDLILGTLDHCLGNRTHAANILGISIRTLRNKLKTYSDAGVTVPDGADGERKTS